MKIKIPTAYGAITAAAAALIKAAFPTVGVKLDISSLRASRQKRFYDAVERDEGVGPSMFDGPVWESSVQFLPLAGTQVSAWSTTPTAAGQLWLDNGTDDTIGAFDAMSMHVLAGNTQNQNQSRYYFKAFGMAGGRSWFVYPAGLTAADFQQGCSRGVNAIIRMAVVEKEKKALPRQARLLLDAGYDMWRTVNIPAGTTYVPINNKGEKQAAVTSSSVKPIPIAFLCWQGGYAYPYIGDTIGDKVRNDLNRIAEVMTSKKASNQGKTQKETIKASDITGLKFFTTSGEPAW